MVGRFAASVALVLLVVGGNAHAEDQCVERWIKQLKGDEAEAALEEILETWPPPKEVMSATFEVFRKDKKRRALAGKVLTWIGPPAVPGLVGCLARSEAHHEAGRALAPASPPSSEEFEKATRERVHRDRGDPTRRRP